MDESDANARSSDRGPTSDEPAGDDADIRTLVDRLHEHVEATGERPVETGASRWLGEAEAVAADAASGPPESALRKRIDQVDHLLSEVEGTGDEVADRHVERARDLLDRIQRRLAE